MLIGCTSLALFFAAFFVSRSLQQFLPEDHRSDQSAASVRVGVAVVSTLSGLVLGLVLSTMKTNFDTVQRDVRTFGTELVLLDTALRSCEELGRPARAQLLDYARAALKGTWPDDGADVVVDDRAAIRLLQRTQHMIVSIASPDPAIGYFAASARDTMGKLVELRTTIVSENRAFLPPVFLVMLISWFTILFASFGYGAPTNLTVSVSVLLAAFAVASAIGVMTELDGAFTGLVTVSSAPIRDAIALLEAP